MTLPDTIKSLVLKKPGELVLEEKPLQKVGPNDALVRVKAAGICHTDFVVIEGHDWTDYPTVLGHEYSGIVEKTGSEVFHVKPGDRVTSMSWYYCGICEQCRRGESASCKNMRAISFNLDGAFQEYLSVPASMLWKIPESISFEVASVTEPSANALSVVEQTSIEYGKDIAIIGPGPIGLLTTQVATFKQPNRLIMLGTRNERLDLARQFGATHTINVGEKEPYKEIMDITDGQGVDVVLFCGGGKEAWDLANKILKTFGRLSLEANPNETDATWPLNVYNMLMKGLWYKGIFGYNSGDFDTALKLIVQNKIDVASIITHRFKLQDYKNAFETAEKRLDGAVKVLFTF